MRKILTSEQVNRTVATAVAKMLTNLLPTSSASNTNAEEFFYRRIQQMGFADALNDKIQQNAKSTMKKKRGITKEELSELTAQWEAKIARSIPLIRKAGKEMLKQLPRHGGPGRKGALDKSEKLEAIELISSGLKLGKIKNSATIFASVAQTFKSRGKTVSARTIKRIWGQRASLYEI